MRRTYRSKKETGNALDHRDVIQNLDEKDSVFDAFYIQKIKQTKRELSCIGSTNHYGAPGNKVRKRKYVKRIVKEAEHSPCSLRDSISQSAFLTPDKSIRVNKAQDLFDQLFNSSSPMQTESPVNSRQCFSKFQPKVQGKTYTRKKLSKVKKFNCSSSDSNESDKENSNESHDVTDIRNHELLIEKQKQPPKHLDESINNIVKKLSILNNFGRSRNSSGNSVKESVNKYQDHRLTTNFASPDLSKSPLCSTPFKEKYRSQSIYKFSPIGIDKNETSPNYVTIVEESFNDNGNADVFEKDNKSVISVEECTPPSPIIQLSVNKSGKSNKSSKNTTTSDTESSSPINDAIPTPSTDPTNIKNSELISIEISELQTTELEPFIGFSNPKILENSVVNLAEQSLLHSRCNKPEDFIDSNIIIANDEKNELSQNEVNKTTSDLSSDSQETEDYDTCNSDQSLEELPLNDKRVPVVKLERLNNSMLMKYYTKQLNDYEEQEEESSEIESDDYESFESDPSLENSNNFEKNNDDIESTFEETICGDNVSYSHKKHLEENNLSQDIFKNSDEIELDNNEMEIANEADTIEDSILLNNIDCTRNEEEERCISFVTTRRRNEVTNDSMIFNFNNSLDSTSSADCDKTVLSNNEIRIKTDLSSNPEVVYESEANKEAIDIQFQNLAEKSTDAVNTSMIMDTSYDNFNLTTKELPITHIDSDNMASCSKISSVNSDDETFTKPAIVLQPGKKWERSLSIYRRMTMMTDTFDHSILDDEQLQTKGRKYRQSVISTMEMQDFKGSLHNESIISRRSTFVSKPNRSTIRIIKEPNSSRLSLCTSTISEEGFVSEVCDDTVVELSKLSIADSEHEVTVLENFHETSNRVSTAKDYVLRRCNQTDAIHFDECYPETVLKNCRKIGEGVYGEVYLWRARDGRARVMKIVPIAGTTKVNGEHQKDFHEIISEIVIAMELSALRAPIDEIQRDFDEGKTIDALDLHSVENATDVFNEVLAVRCVYGTYPSRLLDLWELYDESRGSENDNPAVLPADQQYIVLELANAGQDLESYEFNSAEQAHALFLQIAFGLAVAEEAFQFEHRDLHWGNVLIAPTDQKFALFVLRGRAHLVPRCGVAGTIIDYSLSRLSLPLAGERAALYNDLAADDGLFDAVGDRQFEVYRLMRDKLGNDWKNFEPYTNILWLHYTVEKMITALRYKRTNTKIHKHYIAKLKGIKNRILDYGSAAQFVLTDNEF